MASRLQDVDLASGLDVMFLGAILLGALQLARHVTADQGGTPNLLRLSTGGGFPATAPELGLLRPAGAGPTTAGSSLGVPELAWVLLSLAVLAAIGALWLRTGRPG